MIASAFFKEASWKLFTDGPSVYIIVAEYPEIL